ncbi:hypothetical protein PUR59_00035 [Streptomyces sp. SP18ES09]|nr:hypothetical protein [Streptomyces sp. SP18ES09]MEE1813461.1 hypothetical protein [Streptomyces sp. SP18ES09]
MPDLRPAAALDASEELAHAAVRPHLHAAPAGIPDGGYATEPARPVHG